ncbi:MAG TPA: monofunctional biosynthetic peptidoglycan transglycosylase [Polyangia bacterium]|nr:monofunctional biosynthetic peptidoglycan transglycosylase [Polyangia bacterium]
MTAWRALGRLWPQRRALKVLAILGALAVLGACALWLSLPDVTPLLSANPPTTQMIELRRRQATEAGQPFELHWSWRPLARISPLLRRAVVFSEDAEFWRHEGVDWEAVKQAAERDWHERSLERGASTITQQVAKNLYLSPSRNPIRKLRELLIARRLERALGKERILELYLNIAEWGDAVFGAEAAARSWYGCSAADLSAAQAARLAVALPNPRERSPEVRSRMLDRRAARLVRALRRAGAIDDQAMAAAERALGVAKAETAVPAPGEPAPQPAPETAPETVPETTPPAAPEPAPAAPSEEPAPP